MEWMSVSSPTLLFMCMHLLATRIVFAAASQPPQLHLFRMTASATGAVDIHAVVADREFLDLLQLCLCEQFTILCFPHLTAGGTDHVVMILISVCSLVFRHVSTKLMLDDQSTVEQ